MIEGKVDYDRNRRRTLIGKIGEIYNTQNTKSKIRGHLPPQYSKEEFLKYCINSEKFVELWVGWVYGGYDRLLAPSIDRIKNEYGYSFENIQVMTLEENVAKFHYDIMNGKTTKVIKRVNQICLKTDVVLESFYSIKAASVATNVDKCDISKCANSKRKTAGGFKWMFADVN